MFSQGLIAGPFILQHYGSQSSEYIGIIYVSPCISIFLVPRKLFEAASKYPAKVNALKETCVIVILAFYLILTKIAQKMLVKYQNILLFILLTKRFWGSVSYLCSELILGCGSVIITLFLQYWPKISSSLRSFFRTLPRFGAFPVILCVFLFILFTFRPL